MKDVRLNYLIFPKVYSNGLCRAEYLREWRKKNPTKQKDYDEKRKERHTINRRIRDKKRVTIKRKRPALLIAFRSGVCSVCGEKGLTHLHHEFYIPILPWACTKELCPRHHTSRGIEMGQYSFIKRVVPS